jgi:hypothetical protein
MKKIYFLYLWLIVFGINSIYHYNNICCMFSAERHYGWPFPYLGLWKTTSILAEAELINTQSIFSLLAKGWHLSFIGDMTSPFIWPLALIIDIVASLAISFVIVLIIRGIRYLKAKKR